MTTETETSEAPAVDDRDRRAAEQYLAVVKVKDSPGLFHVYSEDGKSRYLVDLVLEACECPDFEYRNMRCKHLRRVEMEIGERPIPDGVDADRNLVKRREAAENCQSHGSR